MHKVKELDRPGEAQLRALVLRMCNLAVQDLPLLLDLTRFIKQGYKIDDLVGTLELLFEVRDSWKSQGKKNVDVSKN